MFLRNPHPWLPRLTLILLALALLILGYQWGNQYQRRTTGPPRIEGVLIRPPLPLGDFQLQDSLGDRFDRGNLAAGWTLLTLGDLTRASGQLAVQRLIEVYNRLADQTALRRDLRLLLITTSHAPNLARDFASLSPALRILGGDATEIDRVRNTLGLYQEDADSLFLIAPGGYLLALLPDTEAAAAMAEDLKTLYHHASLLLPEHP